MKCGKCHEEIPGDGEFCPRCGGSLQEVRSRSRTRRLVLLMLLAVVGASVFMLISTSRQNGEGNPSTNSKSTGSTVATPDVVHVGVAYGTEKRDWFTWAVDAFSRTSEGRGIQIELIPRGSLEAAQDIVHGDAHIQVWSPASALYKNVFLRDWSAAHPGENPIESEQQLALTPMVFVMWQQRYDAFITRYPEVNFRNIAVGMVESGGWSIIADKPEWGFFKFSHTHPNHSNSGLTSLVLMAYDYHNTYRGLSALQITDPAFQKWHLSIERNLVNASSGLISSTGDLMKQMVLRGPSTYDCIMVYESNAIESLKQATGHWDALRVIYPKYNMWNDHPYYVLNVPGSTPQQRNAANAFAKFLLSEDAQRQAMTHGFRPANATIATNEPDSPFLKFANVGVQSNVPGIFCEPPGADTLETLLLGWQRSQAGK